MGCFEAASTVIAVTALFTLLSAYSSTTVRETSYLSLIFFSGSLKKKNNEQKVIDSAYSVTSSYL